MLRKQPRSCLGEALDICHKFQETIAEVAYFHMIETKILYYLELRFLNAEEKNKSIRLGRQSN